jgi:hypothetical protein
MLYFLQQNLLLLYLFMKKLIKLKMNDTLSELTSSEMKMVIGGVTGNGCSAQSWTCAPNGCVAGTYAGTCGFYTIKGAKLCACIQDTIQ